MAENDKRASRVLYIYDKLKKGCVLNKKTMADEMGVNGRTIQRDLEEVRNYMADHYPGEEIVYDRHLRGYKIESHLDKTLSAVEVFAIIKILLESRAFCQEEMDGLLNIIHSLISKDEQRTIKELIINEKFHFQQLTHGKPLLKMLWDLGQCILKKQVIEIYYYKMDGGNAKRVIHPQSIVFSEFYFYLIAHIEDNRHQEPAFFRVDRLSSFKLLGRKFTAAKYEEGELKKRVQFMYGGQLIRLRFIYKGNSLEAVMDRFPTAVVTGQTEFGFDIKADVFGKGCLMWLLGQGEMVELISPDFLREELKDKLAGMLAAYTKE